MNKLEQGIDMKKNKLVAFATAGLPRATIKMQDGREITMRAFAVKELKLLMMAHTSESAQDTQVLQILDQCIETEGVSSKELPSHEIERLYIELYKISKGSSLIPVQYKCTQEHDGEICNTPINVNVNLNNVVVEGHQSDTVKLANGLTLNMRYPNVLEREYFNDHNENDVFNLAVRCIKSVDTGTEVMVVGEDVTAEEVSEVIEYLDEKSFAAILEFVQNIPTVTMSFPLRCSKCGHKEVVTLRGLADFFD
ncbi:MAG: hypothetical protein ACRC9I_11590 [Acinetobacter sp.]